MRAIAATILLVLSASPALAMGGEPTIASHEGRVGDLHLGKTAAESKELRPHRDGTYRTADGGIVCRVDSRGRIVEISVTTPDLVTERLIRAGRSTLYDLVRAYGTPVLSRDEGDEVVLIYPYVRFYFLRRDVEKTKDDATVARVVIPARVPTRSVAAIPRTKNR